MLCKIEPVRENRPQFRKGHYGYAGKGQDTEEEPFLDPVSSDLLVGYLKK